MRFTHLLLMLATLSATSCSDSNSGFDGMDEYMASREHALLLGRAGILDIRVTGPSRMEHRNMNGTSVDLTLHSARVLGRMVVVGPWPLPTEDPIQITSDRRFVGRDPGDSASFRFNGARYYAPMHEGVRVLVVAYTPTPYVREWTTIAAFRVNDPAGTLAEPALGFPAGTPTSVVLDPSTFRRPEALLDYDAGTQGDASADAHD